MSSLSPRLLSEMGTWVLSLMFGLAGESLLEYRVCGESIYLSLPLDVRGGQDRMGCDRCVCMLCVGVNVGRVGLSRAG